MNLNSSSGGLPKHAGSLFTFPSSLGVTSYINVTTSHAVFGAYTEIVPSASNPDLSYIRYIRLLYDGAVTRNNCRFKLAFGEAGSEVDILSFSSNLGQNEPLFIDNLLQEVPAGTRISICGSNGSGGNVIFSCYTLLLKGV